MRNGRIFSKLKSALVSAWMAATLLLLIGAGTYGVPITLSDALNRIRPGVGRHASRMVLDANTTTELFMVQPGGSVPACYPDRGTLVITSANSSSGEVTCYASLAVTGITLGDQTGEATAVLMTDANGPDGAGNVMTIPANGEWHQTIDVSSQRTNFGARTGLCGDFITAANSVNGYQLRAPCRIDSDCIAAGSPAGTTCLSGQNQDAWDYGCVFVGCRAVNNLSRMTAHFSH